MSENPPNDSKEQLGNDVIESKEEFETGKKAEYEIWWFYIQMKANKLI